MDLLVPRSAGFVQEEFVEKIRSTRLKMEIITVYWKADLKDIFTKADEGLSPAAAGNNLLRKRQTISWSFLSAFWEAVSSRKTSFRCPLENTQPCTPRLIFQLLIHYSAKLHCLINSLKILNCLTNWDSLLFVTLRYTYCIFVNSFLP